MSKTILAVGAHIGDMELTCGALLAANAVHGGRSVTLALTAGEKGAPAGADVAEYRKSKVAEAEAFAAELGGEAIVLGYPDGLLPDNDEARFAVCDVIRRVKPDILITHHAHSMHKDHAACHRIVTDAWFYAAIEGFERDKAVIVGDRLSSDILGGINAGIKTCWFNPKRLPGRADIPADYEIHALSELPELLEKI